MDLDAVWGMKMAESQGGEALVAVATIGPKQGRDGRDEPVLLSANPSPAFPSHKHNILFCFSSCLATDHSNPSFLSLFGVVCRISPPSWDFCF